MNDGHNGEAGIAAAHFFKSGGSRDIGSTVDFRARSPGEIGEQLLRDAQSLELTGASFEKDEAFYRNVAANVREAAAFLAQWHGLVDSIQQGAAVRERTARVAGLLQANRIAETVGALVPQKHVEGPAVTWRQAASAIGGAIMAVADSQLVIPEGVDLEAAKEALMRRCREAGTVEPRT